MSELERRRTAAEPPDADAIGIARPAAPAEAVSDDPPTVRSGSDGGSNLQRRSMMRNMPEQGQRLSTFLLMEPIGVGGMGAVFLAQDTALERPVALKILPPEQSADVEVVQRFYQEAKAAASLDHENIARVFAIGSDQSFHFIAFEYIEGVTLRRRVEQNGPIPVAEAINYSLQICNALIHAAERGVVHRDIKPSNIIITPHGRAKLVDMGLARRFERGGADDGLTQSGMTLGTFDYISPEQARDPRDVDARSDLYSLGCTIFQMLTGRPPFPDGTFLQKLLQHQEEPAPDVRSSNAEVPAELATIILKLMAKERERRYQSPEQLARDLLSLAGSLGLRSISPEGLVWVSPSPAPAWERHLIWAVPSAALGLIVLGLVFWTQVGDSERPPIENAKRVARPPTIENRAPRAPSPRTTAPTDTAKTSEPTNSAKKVESDNQPREIVIRAGDDLASQLASAPSGSTLTIVDDGPFEVRSAPAMKRARGVARDLTVRAAAGAHPVLRLAKPASDPTADATILQFGPGRVVLEGLEFSLDPAAREGDLVALGVDGTDVRIRRCQFRRVGGAFHMGTRLIAVSVNGGAQVSSSGERPAPCVVEESHFDGGQVGILGMAPVDIHLRDCTIGGADPALWVQPNPNQALAEAMIELRHVSLMAADGPVFRIEKTRARVRIDDSVVAPLREDQATLVSIEEPSLLDWYGRGNLYGKVSTYLQPERKDLVDNPIETFELWADDGRGSRESSESVPRGVVVWKAGDPTSLLARRDPGPAFVLSASERHSTDLGARRGASGPIGSMEASLALNGPPASGASTKSAEPPKGDPSTSTPAPGSPTTAAEAQPVTPAQTPTPKPVASAEVPAAAKPLPSDDMERVGMGDPAETKGTPTSPTPKPAEGDKPAADGSNSSRATDVVHTAKEFLEMLRRGGAGTRRVTLASDADIEIPSCDFPGRGRWIIQAEKGGGGSRPRIRFRPALGEARAGSPWPALFRVQSGALELQGVDIVLAQVDAPAAGRWSAFSVWTGTELSVTNCTVTMQGDGPRSAAVTLGGMELDLEAALAGVETSAASIRVSDSIVRVGGDFVDAGAGRRLDLVATNSLMAVGRAIVHGHGLAKGQTPETLKVTLRQVSASAAGGVVYLETTPSEPELPVADVLARETILSTTTRTEPLIRVDGQDDVDGLRDRIQWEGHAVAYHDIQTYRLDESAQPGSIPVRFDRQSWDLAVGPRETDAIHDDVRFERPWTQGRASWTATRDDFRLASASPAQSVGPNLAAIPDPPSAEVIDRESGRVP
jgi:eukaryotic-like serine/threonine-protein kinase